MKPQAKPGFPYNGSATTSCWGLNGQSQAEFILCGCVQTYHHHVCCSPEFLERDLVCSMHPGHLPNNARGYPRAVPMRCPVPAEQTGNKKIPPNTSSAAQSSTDEHSSARHLTTGLLSKWGAARLSDSELTQGEGSVTAPARTSWCDVPH